MSKLRPKSLEPCPKCEACGLEWLEHGSMEDQCFVIKRFRAERDEAQEIAKKYEDRYFNTLVERDEARREACERTAENLSLLGSNVRLSTLRVEHAARRGWDCYAEPRWKSDPNIISPEELARCTRNDHND